MDDIATFERRVAAEVIREMGPSEPVDDAAIYHAITATGSPRWRSLRTSSATRLLVAAVVVALFGGFLMIAQPADQAVTVPGAWSDPAGVVATPQPPKRDSIAWGSKVVRFTPPPGWATPVAGGFRTFAVHDVKRIAGPCDGVVFIQAGDERESPTFVEVGPSADDLANALAGMPSLIERAGPADVLVDGYPATMTVMINSSPPPCHGGEASVAIWENTDGSEFRMLGGDRGIVIVADVDGQRLVIAGGLRGIELDEVDITELEGQAQAMVASMDIVEPDPMEAAWVTGVIRSIGSPDRDPETSVEQGVTASHGSRAAGMGRIEASDPRLLGELSTVWNEHLYEREVGDDISVASQSYRIVGDEGTWEGSGIKLGRGQPDSHRDTVSDAAVLVGSGAYEGLTAYLLFDLDTGPGTIAGAIFAGEPPAIATFPPDSRPPPRDATDIPTAEGPRWVWVTGTSPYSGTRVGTPEYSTEDGVTKASGVHWEDMGPVEMSDPRLSGVHSSIWDQASLYVADDDEVTLTSGTSRIVNEAGSWENAGVALSRGTSTLDTVSDAGVWVGHGAYEGLNAFLVFDYRQDPVTIVGAIFPGEMPPIPVPR
jgi:hypothetical protein